mmetsp:Transcript_21752/g.49563  ORF Transcript_21752/g.49563 Transcript_21752/m.49563 type:complete len:221 (+) Transcript_21752:60-722(+)
MHAARTNWAVALREQPRHVQLKAHLCLRPGAVLREGHRRGCAGRPRILLVEVRERARVLDPLLRLQPDRCAGVVDIAVRRSLLRPLLARRHVPSGPRMDLVRRHSHVLDPRQARRSPLLLSDLLRDDPVTGSEELPVVRHAPGQLGVVLQHALGQVSALLHPVEVLATALGFIDRSAVQVAAMPQEEAWLYPCLLDAEYLEANDADRRDLVDPLDCLVFV